ncbi:hypothetical protein MICAE_2060038 [Microcystis aeruginosa PCC 9806]|uniref:Uncharacterized protein n=1 Tax=Microcystis aeruginosa PCC 9806 TaxID=1160282 RepID=I4GV60_MICAE|nr:hypothetical protein MICAE_2060038 [Microcystis aeruginosa PCC 9806]
MEGKDNHAILTVTVDNPNPQPITFNYKWVGGIKYKMNVGWVEA